MADTLALSANQSPAGSLAFFVKHRAHLAPHLIHHLKILQHPTERPQRRVPQPLPDAPGKMLRLPEQLVVAIARLFPAQRLPALAGGECEAARGVKLTVDRQGRLASGHHRPARRVAEQRRV